MCRRLRSTVALLAVFAACLNPDARSFQNRDRPNIIFIMMDDLHYDDLGCYGNSLIQTPNIDRLAREGLRFTQYYANGPVCSPTRAGILTGQYPHWFNFRFVVRYVGYPGDPNRPRARMKGSHRGIPERITTLADVLKAQGYRSLHLGKWHLGRRKPEFGPVHQGFDHSLVSGAGRQSVHRDNLVFADHAWTTQHPFETIDGYLTDYLTDRAVDFISSSDARPFFLNLWLVAPHVPLDAPPRWTARYPDTEHGLYAAMVSHVDENVGRIIETLGTLGLRRKTLVFVTSDNGGERSTHADSRLRGFKTNLFEGGIRVPLVASWPGRVPEDAVTDEVTLGFDILPTIADLLGSEDSTGGVEGRSFKSVLLGRRATSNIRTLFWEYGGSGLPASGDNFAVRRGDWKLLSARGRPALFNLRQDPAEVTNLASHDPNLVTELLEAYQHWRIEERRLPIRIGLAAGDVRIADRNSLEASFGLAGGVVILEDDPLYVIHDGDFSLSLRIELSTEALEGRAVIAHQKGSWSLHLRKDLKLALAVHGEEVDSELVTLASRNRLRPGRWHHVSFTIRGHLVHPSNISLYVDGELQAVNNELSAVNPGEERIHLGSDDGYLHNPFVGRFQDLRLYLMPLTEDEVQTLSARG